ncbi:MAG: hypothetical protein ACK514_06160 [Bacteroidota bacterium]|jgi:hypothetical protein|nr:hypothetical protein [Cytophagales bacterium]
MKRTILTLLSLILFVVVAFGQNENELVRNSFNNYKKSILEGSGKEAIKYVNIKTIDYYDKELDLAVNGDSSAVSQLGVMDKLTVFIARHRIPKEDLINMTGRDFFIYAVDNGMIGKNSVVTTQIGDVNVKANFANGQMISNGQKTPLYFQFSKEENEWKIDLTSIFPQVNFGLTKMLSEQGLTDNDFIFQTLESLTGRKVTNDIWRSLK